VMNAEQAAGDGRFSASGDHSYAEQDVFPSLKLTLCNFRDADFGSFDSAYFGLPRNARIGYQRMCPESIRASVLRDDLFGQLLNLEQEAPQEKTTGRA